MTLAARELVGTHDVALVTLDSLRFDVAREAWALGETPTLAGLLPGTGWEARHTPGSFTYAAHQAFFAGFLPTPARPGRHPRLFAARFAGSETTSPGTFTFDEATLPEALAARGYHTVCVGGVGFFNGRSALGSALPSLFAERYWSPATGVTAPRSAERQFRRAADALGRVGEGRRAFVFVNVSATHTPTWPYVPGATRDSTETQRAALRSVDASLGVLIGALRARGPSLVVLCADHGTCFGDDGYWGHRVAHPAVWTVPYAELLLPGLDHDPHP